MGAFIGEYAQTGRFIDGAGLGASKTRTRLVFRDGRCTVKHGPYRGEHELPAATLLLKVRTREEAIGWAERYGKILGDGEIELGKVTEPWDLGLMPAPENPPLQMLLIEKADPATEAGGRSPKQKADLTRLKTEMTKAGVLVRAVQLQPSAKAKRLRLHQQRPAGDRRAVRGVEGADRRLRDAGAVGHGRGDRDVPALRGDPRRDARDRRAADRCERCGRVSFRTATGRPTPLSASTTCSVPNRWAKGCGRRHSHTSAWGDPPSSPCNRNRRGRR